MHVNNMHVYFDLLSHNRQQQQNIQKICEPLFLNFPISNFFYAKYFLDGRYFIVGTNYKAIEIYLNHNASCPDQFFLQEFVDIPYLCKHKFIWPSASQNLPPGVISLRKLNILNGFNLSINKGNYLETYIFSSHIETPKAHEFYLNHSLALERFVDFFQEQGKILINEKLIKNLPLSELYKKKIKEINLKSYIPKNINCFMEQTKLSKYLIYVEGNEIKLSNREFDCLKYVSRGKSIKETAHLLSLSHHTVEAYLQQIKLKLGVSSKSKVIELFIQSLPSSSRHNL